MEKSRFKIETLEERIAPSRAFGAAVAALAASGEATGLEIAAFASGKDVPIGDDNGDNGDHGGTEE
jgi:hypothetical protein